MQDDTTRRHDLAADTPALDAVLSASEELHSCVDAWHDAELALAEKREQLAEARADVTSAVSALFTTIRESGDDVIELHAVLTDALASLTG